MRTVPDRRAEVAKTVELNVKEWNEVLRRLKKYAETLTKGSVLQGSADDADDLVERAITRWLQRGLTWKEDAGPPTVPAVVGYLKKAVLNAYLDRLKQSAATHEAPPTKEDIPVNEEIKLLREHLDHLVTHLRPFLSDDPLAELYIDLQLGSDEFLSDDDAARQLDRDTTVKDIRNMKKRLERHVRDMRAAMQAN
jgi:DNA-directed RNA polymerase specialized sigma24 family protein